ncbi:MAG: hypothetical protein ACRDOK_07785 [Streptosporangiaceae bacterium]
MSSSNSSQTKVRPGVAAFAATCSVGTAAGGLLTWVTASGPRPMMGMDHTSLPNMLVYSFAHSTSPWTSVGLAVLVLGLLMAIGALAGLRTVVVLAALLALAAADMWIGLITHHYNTPSLPNSHYANPVNLPWADLRTGAWLTICGAVLGLVSSFSLRARTSRGRERAGAGTVTQ